MSDSVFLISIIVSVFVSVFYLKNLQDTLMEVSAKNRKVEPGNVWLMYIPLFNLVYPFILYPKISDSLRAEFIEKGQPQSGDYYRTVGTILPVLTLVGLIPIPYFGLLALALNLILWILYWSKMAEYKIRLRSMITSTDTQDISRSID